MAVGRQRRRRLVGMPAVRLPGVGAGRSGAPSPADGIGARPPSTTPAGSAPPARRGLQRGCAALRLAGRDAGAGATGAGPRLSACVLRLPNTQLNSNYRPLTPTASSACRAAALSRPAFGFLHLGAAGQQLRKLPERLGGAVRWTTPRRSSGRCWRRCRTVCGSNGMTATGWSSSALAKSAGLISGRFGTPTWLRQ